MELPAQELYHPGWRQETKELSEKKLSICQQIKIKTCPHQKTVSEGKSL
jgi:hypothetical protein